MMQAEALRAENARLASMGQSLGVLLSGQAGLRGQVYQAEADLAALSQQRDELVEMKRQVRQY